MYVADLNQQTIVREFTGEAAPGQKEARANLNLGAL